MDESESNFKLWQYIYHDKRPNKLIEETNKQYLETSTTDDSRVDQLCDQLLLHKNNLPSNHFKKGILYKNSSNYSNLGLDQSFEPDTRHRNVTNKLIYNLFYKHFYKSSYLIILFGLLSFIGFILIIKLTNLFHASFTTPSSLLTSFTFKRNHTISFDQSSSHQKAEQLVNLFSSFERVLTIETECASYTGTVNEGAFEFLGIQYAVPPVRDLRFRPTVPIWNNSTLCNSKQIKKAKKYKSDCFQINPFNKKYHGSEDCLYLDIYTPRLDTTAFLDVMIFLHPGFLQFGSAHLPGLSPSGSLAKKLNVVFVAFNYRLDALGFFPLAQFVNSTNNAIDGNFALYDQITAVEWVKRNIKLFGGNPNKIVLFGSDGAGASILALATSTFRSSISKIWLPGPAVYLNKQFSLSKFLSKNRSAQQNSQAKLTDCKTIECFQRLDPKELINYFLDGDQPEFRIVDQNDLPIQNIYNNQWILIPHALVNDAYPFNRKSSYDRLQFLIGTSKNAVEFYPGPNDIRNWTYSSYTKYVRTSLDSFDSSISQLALEHYLPNVKPNVKSSKRPIRKFIEQNEINSPDNLNELNQLNSYVNKREKLNPEELYTQMVSDIKQTCPVNLVSKNLAKFHNATVFRYIVYQEPSQPVKLFGHKNRFAFHLFDLIAFFDALNLFIDQPTKSDLMFSRNVQNMVMNFVKKPDCFDEADSIKNKTREEDDLLKLDNLVGFDNEYDHLEKSNMLSTQSNKWFSYPKSLALINETISFVDETDNLWKRCKFWEDKGLDRYVWTC